jgi:hypothetical protein
VECDGCLRNGCSSKPIATEHKTCPSSPLPVLPGYLSIVTGLRDGRPGFDSQKELGFSHYAISSMSTLGPNLYIGLVRRWVKKPGRESIHSPPPVESWLRMRGAEPLLPALVYDVQCCLAHQTFKLSRRGAAIFHV